MPASSGFSDRSAERAAPPAHTCRQCGATFELPAHIRDQYPDWTPQLCRRCHGRASDRRRRSAAPGQSAAAASSAAPDTTPGTAAGAASDREGRPAPRRRGRRRTSTAAVEENLTVAEVLERYTAGPQDGVFTDGSSHPNPGPGGWGAVFVRGGQVVDRAWGHERHTTNNRMELTALIAGFDLVPAGESATVYTDSRLCVDTITKWAPGWARNGWRRKSGPVQNLDLVQQLYERAQARPELTLQWIKAHDGSRWNEYADALSTAYRRDDV